MRSRDGTGRQYRADGRTGDIAAGAGGIHRAHFRSAHLQVEIKPDASPVTVADRASEEAIRTFLKFRLSGFEKT